MVMNEAKRRIESYLSRLRKQLRKRSAGNWKESVTELRSHIVERATVGGEMTEASVEGVLQCLGSPEELAEQYLTDALPWDSEANSARFRYTRQFSRWTRVIVTGVPVLLLATIGYLLGGVFLICALSKPFHPYSAGLWRIPDLHDVTISLRLGLGSGHPPAGSADLLGWWIIPIGLLSCYVLLSIATQLALRSFRLFRGFHGSAGDHTGGLIYEG